MPTKGTTTTKSKAAPKAGAAKPKAAKPGDGNGTAGKAPEVAALPIASLPTANIATRGVVSVPIVPTTLDDCWRLSQYLSQSMMCRDLPGTAGSNMNVSAILAILQQGATVGLPPMSALAAFTIIEGRLAMYGDGQLAVLMGTGVISELIEKWIDLPSDDTALEDWPIKARAICEMTRAETGRVCSYEFSVGDAIRAELWNQKTSKGNATAWMKYPKRMLRLRARAFCARDTAPDILLGFQHTAEELIDITPEQTSIVPSIPVEADYVDAPHVPDLPEPGEAYEIDEDKSVINVEMGEVIEQEDTGPVGEPELDDTPDEPDEPEAAFVCVDWNGDEHEWPTLDEAVVGLAGVVALSPDLDSLMAFIKDNEIPALMASENISEGEMTQLGYAINQTKKKHTGVPEPEPETEPETKAEPTSQTEAESEPEFTTKTDVTDPSQHAAWYKTARDELRGLGSKAAVDRFEKHIAPALDKIPGTHKASLVRLCESQRKRVKKKGGKK